MTAPNEPRDAVASDEPPTREEIAAILLGEGIHHPAPPPTPVRARYYLTECEHCGWVGSSEHLGIDEDDISCSVCCQSICGDGPSEADAAKHGEAVYQRIVTAEAEIERLRAENTDLRLQWEGMAELVCEFAAQETPDALILVGRDRDQCLKRAYAAEAQLVTLREQLAAAEARAEEAEKQVGELSATVTAWDGAFGIIQSHLQDRIAMNDPARPETYLRIVEASVSELPRISRQIYAATQYRSQATQAYAERVSDENEALNAALSEERARVAGIVDKTLTEWTRPSAVRLMVGEMMSAQEARTADAVAKAIAAKIRHALTPEPSHDA